MHDKQVWQAGTANKHACTEKEHQGSRVGPGSALRSALAAASVIHRGMIRPRDDEVGELQSTQASDHQ